jgi:hypothetical protein
MDFHIGDLKNLAWEEWESNMCLIGIAGKWEFVGIIP